MDYHSHVMSACVLKQFDGHWLFFHALKSDYVLIIVLIIQGRSSKTTSPSQIDQ